MLAAHIHTFWSFFRQPEISRHVVAGQASSLGKLWNVTRRSVPLSEGMHNLRASEACETCEADVRGTQFSLKNTRVSL